MAIVTTNFMEKDAGPSASLAVAIRKSLGEFTLDSEFTAPAGITILFGASGSGKTTLLNCLAGLSRPDSGRIAIGDRVLFDSERRIDIPAEQRNAGYVFQDLALFPHLSVGANVEYGLFRLPVRTRRERSQAILEGFRIADLRDRKPREISGGQRQRVALARSLVMNPSILLLDEPLSGLDAPTRSRLIDDLRAWNDEHRIPMMYVTHAREEVFALSERVMVFEAGKLLAQGSPYEVLQAPRQEAIAELTGVENLFDGVVLALHESQGTMTCELSGAVCEGQLHLEVPLATVKPGARVRIGIRAGDIILATSAPKDISARNVLSGRLVALTRRDITVVAQVDCGVLFEVHLTPAAETSLQLHAERQVWVIIKTHSCLLLRSR
jgi:molybdate transport system ATP-binding protein